MTLADLAAFEPEWVEPISTTYRGWTVYELPPNTQGIAALMMLDIMEPSRSRECGLHSADGAARDDRGQEAGLRRHAALASRDPTLRARCRCARCSIKARAQARAAAHRHGEGGLRRRSRSASPGSPTRRGRRHDLSLGHRSSDGNIVSLIQSIFSALRQRASCAPGTGFALHNRGGALHARARPPERRSRRASGRCTPSFRLHAQGRRAQIGFGIMGGFNQAQAHAQFVAEHRRLRLDDPAGARGRPLHQADLSRAATSRSRRSCPTRRARSSSGSDTSCSWSRRGSPTSAGARPSWPAPTRVHFGASEPRHDGAAIPESLTDLRRRRARTLGRP